jgi:hypothetical protein
MNYAVDHEFCHLGHRELSGGVVQSMCDFNLPVETGFGRL